MKKPVFQLGRRSNRDTLHVSSVEARECCRVHVATLASLIGRPRPTVDRSFSGPNGLATQACDRRFAARRARGAAYDGRMSASASPLIEFAETRRGEARLWFGYASLSLLCWMLYVVAGTDWVRGSWRLWEPAYEATWNLGPPILLGTLALPWVRWLQRRERTAAVRLGAHALGALVFAVLWQLLDFALSSAFFGRDHAVATFEQRIVWRSAWAVFVYTALVSGFGGALYARRAHRAALARAQAEAALVRAELAAISGKLNPHFLFNTLNSIIFLTRKDPGAAERALLSFARMLRYLLDSNRGAADRVSLREELDFVRDYLDLETLRLGTRLVGRMADRRCRA